MSSPILQATISACILCATSNIAAQCITAYRINAPYTIDWTPVIQFVVFTALNTPPNFLWQQFLESTFPSHTLRPSSSAILAAATNDEKELDTEQSSHTILESKLSIPNTIYKFLLDQTVGATLNTLAFSLGMAALRGAHWPLAVQIARQEFWTIMRAGWLLWPMVSILNYVFIKSVEMRNLLGNLAGVGWSIYLCLLADPR